MKFICSSGITNILLCMETVNKYIYYIWFLIIFFADNEINQISGLDPVKLSRLHTLELRGNKLETTEGVCLPNLKNLFLVRKWKYFLFFFILKNSILTSVKVLIYTWGKFKLDKKQSKAFFSLHPNASYFDAMDSFVLRMLGDLNWHT